MPFVPAAKVLCKVCGKAVYPNDEVRLDEDVFHKTCIRCAHCTKIVPSTQITKYNGVIYCKPHFISLFKTRGKYTDLAQGSDGKPLASVTSAKHAEPQAEEKEIPSRTKVSKRKYAPKDLGFILRSRNAAAVSAFLEKDGLAACFQAGADGVTPIELAFTTGNVECGRVMINAIQEALRHAGSFHKPEPAEPIEHTLQAHDQEEIPSTEEPSPSLSAQKSPEPTPESLPVEAPPEYQPPLVEQAPLEVEAPSAASEAPVDVVLGSYVTEDSKDWIFSPTASAQ